LELSRKKHRIYHPPRSNRTRDYTINVPQPNQNSSPGFEKNPETKSTKLKEPSEANESHCR